MMGEWKKYKLKDVCTILGDGLHGTPIYDDKGEFFFINGNNLKDGRISIKNDTKRVPYSEANKYKKPLNNRTILVSINGTIGNVAKYQDEKCILGKSACFFNVKENVDLNFIYYVVANQQFKNTITQLATGTTIKNVSLETMRNYTFCIPPLSIQKQIGKILSSFDDKIELNRRINDNLEQQAQALFKSWFVDFEPFKDGKFVDSELGMIPEGWRVGNLLDIAKLYDAKRKPLSSRERENMKKIYPYYGATSIMDYVDKYIFDGTYLLMGEDGSVMDNKGYPYLQYVFGKFWSNNHAHVMQGKNNFSTEMLHCLLLKKNISPIVTGAVQAKISQANMRKILITQPPHEITIIFSSLIKPIYEIRKKNELENQRLSILRDTLLPKLMSGELIINDINN